MGIRRPGGVLFVCLTVAVSVLFLPWIARATRKPEVSSGGYMKARDKKGKTLVLPLRHTAVDAQVAGAVASVKVTQHFVNPSSGPIEAVYVFPLPHRAAVYGMTITVGNRRIRAVVKERRKARAVYLRARAAGKTAALLEQERPNIFTQSVANIMPGEQIRVELKYVEDLLPDGARYEFVFPMVVGPRYMGGSAPARTSSGGKGWARDSRRVPDASRISPRLLRKGKRPGRDISLRLRIDGGGVAVKHLRVITHGASVSDNQGVPTVTLDPADTIPNKDFVARYQLSGARPEVGVLTHRDARGGHLLLMIQPREKMRPEHIAPREFVFVVDNSGSMYGFPMQQARAVMRRSLKSLRNRDTFQVIKFAGAPDQLARRPLFATQANIRRGMRYIKRMQGGGGTEFLPALQRALRAPKDPTRARVVLFITDGYIGYEHEVLRYLRKYGGESNIFALGIGSSVNRFLIDGMARIGGGRPFYLLNQENASAKVEKIFSTISRPSMTNIDLEWRGVSVSDMSPRAIPDLFGGRPVVLAGRFSGSGQGTVTVHGRLAGKPFRKEVKVSLPARPGGSNEAVAYLWARRRIANQMDRYATEQGEQKAIKKSVTSTALAYNLMSRFTSLVAVDERVRNITGQSKRADVPVPLPAGVSERAAPPGAYGVRGPAAAASRSGVLGLLKSGMHKGEEGKMAFAEGSALGSDADKAIGSLIGGQVGETYGIGGLGLKGTGRGGGGGTGSGTIGLGTLGTIGKGGGGSGAGYGRGVGRLRGRRASASSVRAGNATVRGALSKEIIRRVIRRHSNEVRYCYQKGLQGDPAMAGQVKVGFTISPSGQVTGARVSGSSLGDAEVEECVTEAVGRWQFPQPKGGGMVMVNYPFRLGKEADIRAKEAAAKKPKKAVEKPSTSPAAPTSKPTAAPAPTPAPASKPKHAPSPPPKVRAKPDPRSPESDGGCSLGGASRGGWLMLLLLFLRLRFRR